MYQVINTPQYGRGIYSARTIGPGTKVMTCELLVLSAEDTLKVNDTELKYYTFKYSDTQDCLCLGLSEIFNHDDNANVSYALEDHDGRKVMVFTAEHMICSGQQLFIDYAADTEVDVQKYIDQPSLTEGE